jgi:hypothetical protein
LGRIAGEGAAMTAHPTIDPRLAFLARASAWLALIEAGTANLDAAIESLGAMFCDFAMPPCQCEREILDRWGRNYQEWRRQPQRRSA